MGAFSSNKSIPDDLKLDGHIDVQPRPDFPNDPEVGRGGAVALDSPWMGHLITLFECDSPEPTGNCLNDQNPEFDTPATFSWHLRPVFMKKPHNEEAPQDVARRKPDPPCSRVKAEAIVQAATKIGGRAA
jgi:hypothetical protein